MTNQIKRAYVRRYRDNGQVVAYVDWSDGSRTEATAYMHSIRGKHWGFTFGSHMHALFNRAKREGIRAHLETWA